MSTTQSAISLKLKRLEVRLGTRLVERTPRYVEVSAPGRALRRARDRRTVARRRGHSMGGDFRRRWRRRSCRGRHGRVGRRSVGAAHAADGRCRRDRQAGAARLTALAGAAALEGKERAGTGAARWTFGCVQECGAGVAGGRCVRTRVWRPARSYSRRSGSGDDARLQSMI